MRRRKPGRPGPDDGDALTSGRRELAGNTRFEQAGKFFDIGADFRDVMPDFLDDFSRRMCFGACLFAGKTFESADGDRSVGSNELTVVIHARNFAAPASRFARRATNASTDGSKRIRPTRNQVSLFEVAGRNRTYITSRIGMDRTG